MVQKSVSVVLEQQKDNIKDFFKFHGSYVPIEVPEDKKPKDLYIQGECDMYGTDRSGLASHRNGFKHQSDTLFCLEIISKGTFGAL